MLHNEEFFEVDPEKKDAVWADRIVTHFRSYWTHLINPAVAKEGMDIILSRNDMSNVMKMFKDPKKMGMEFLPIAVMEKIRNILIGERVKSGVSVSLNAIDPSAESDREKDKKLLKNRKGFEDLMTYLHAQIGLPEYKLSQEKDAGGKSPYRGNVEMFDELGLDENSTSQVSYFFAAWHRLLHEMRGQECVNYYIESSELKDNVAKWCNDIMGKKVIAGQSYVNEITGAIEHKYIAPERVRVIPGKRDDGKDAPCIGYEDDVTVGELIKRMGSEFTFERDMSYLLMAVNSVNNREITGIWDDGKMVWGSTNSLRGGTTVQWNEFLNFKISLGYIEFKSYDATVYKAGNDWHDNFRRYPRPVSYLNEKSEDSKYVKEAYYNEVTYKGYYLSTSTNTQRLFKFGPLNHQMVEGEEDEYSNFSVYFKKEPGPTVAQVAEPWIEMAQEAFTKFRWMVRKAKPKGRSYNYESLVAVANKMISEGGSKTKIHEVIKMFEEGINEIFTIPKVEGQPVGGGNNANYDLPNGLDPTALSFKQIVDWCVESIKGDLGINEIREAYSPKPNDGYRLQMQSLEQSRNATNYMSDMIDKLMQQFAKYTLKTVQDIIKYKDSIPYAYLKRAIGKTAIRDISELEDVAWHRYGIFVNSFATYRERQRVLAETNQAWQNKEISYSVKMLVDSIDDYRKAAFIIAFEKERAEKRQDQQAELLHQRNMQVEQQKHANKMEEIQAEGFLDIRERQVQGYYYLQAAIAQSQGRMQETQMKINAEPDKINMKKQAAIEEKRTEASLEMQESLIS